MTDAADFSDCRTCSCAAARREAARLTRIYDERLRPFGLSISQFTLLTTLILRGPATVGVLADWLGVERTTLSRNLAIGIERKLVASEPGPDARERRVSITELGRKAAEDALPAWRSAQAEVNS